jgi:hypothetical protein
MRHVKVHSRLQKHTRPDYISLESMMSDKTPEQLAAEQAAAAAAQAKAAEAAAAKEAKAQEAARKKEEREAAKAAKLAEAEAKKAELEAAKAAKVAEKEAAKKAKEDEKARKAAEKEAAKAAKQKPKMPEQNGVRRPGPDGECGKAWAVFDSISQSQNAPCAISQAITVAKAMEPPLNEGNLRTEYARWKKFNGLTGKIDAPKTPEQIEAEKAAAAKAAELAAQQQAAAQHPQA